MKEVVIAGGGASGMMAGIILGEKGYNVTIIEKNDRLGKKLFITGKGKCNLTNCCDVEELLKNVVSNSRFLYSAFYGFTSEQTMDYFEDMGVPLKVERGNRVFPASDHSSDIIGAMSRRLKELNTTILLDTRVCDIITQKNEEGETLVKEVHIEDSHGKRNILKSEYVVIATGGKSYPLTGSTGDGFKWAKKLGLDVVKPEPALVPMETKEDFCKDLMGLSLKNVRTTFVTKVKQREKVIYSDFGEMLFTHFGVSGPMVLSASSYIGKFIETGVTMIIDLKPALDEKQLDTRILRDFSENINRQFRNSLGNLLPKRLIDIVIEKTGITPYKEVNKITREERQRLIYVLKNFKISITGLRGFEEAIITRGGVSVKEINPHNMECKSIKGLYFVGEVLDVDALTGGFNLQIAWSTAAALS